MRSVHTHKLIKSIIWCAVGTAYKYTQPKYMFPFNLLDVALGDVVLVCLQLDPWFGASNPAEDDGTFKDDKNRQRLTSEGKYSCRPMS
jgi:hypothetical protein